jgi:hypothetical protein
MTSTGGFDTAVQRGRGRMRLIAPVIVLLLLALGVVTACSALNSGFVELRLPCRVFADASGFPIRLCHSGESHEYQLGMQRILPAILHGDAFTVTLDHSHSTRAVG